MKRTWTIKPAQGSWALPVLISGKCDGKSRFCDDYCALCKRMIADKFPIPRMGKIIDDMAGWWVISNQDMFAGCGQVRLAEHVQKWRFLCLGVGSFSFWLCRLEWWTPLKCFSGWPLMYSVIWIMLTWTLTTLWLVLNRLKITSSTWWLRCV